MIRRSLAACVLVVLGAVPASAAIARTCNRADGAFINGGTTGTFDSTGSSLIVIGISYNEGFAPVVTSTPALTWTLLTDPGSATGVARLAYALTTASSATHTVTLTGSNTYAAVEVSCWSGTATTSVLQTDTTARADNVLTIANPSVTPAANGSLIITALGHATAGATPTIDSGFSVSDRTAVSGGNNYGGALGYLIQTTAGAVTPAWTWTGAVTSPSTTIAVFRAATSTVAHIVSGGASSIDAGGSSTTAVSGAVTTTGATLLVMACSQYNGGGASGVAVASDSKANVWAPLTDKTDDSGSVRTRIFYVNSATPIVGTGHTFTCTGSDTYGNVMYAAFSGTSPSPYELQASSQTGSGASLGLLTSFTPAQSGDVIVAALAVNGGSPVSSGFSVNESMTLAYSEAESAGTSGAAWAYKIQSPAAAIQPTFSWSTGTTSPAAIVSAAFRPFGAVIPGSPTGLMLLGAR